MHLGGELHVQQQMYLHSGQPSPLQVHSQIPPHQAPYQHLMKHPGDIYHCPHCFDVQPPHYQHPPTDPSNSNHIYYANHNRHPHYPPLAPTDDYYDIDDKNYTGPR